MYDYEASLNRLAECVSQMRTSNWSPTQEARDLRALAHDLNDMADRLWDPKWASLETAFDAEERVIDLTTGAHITVPRTVSFAGLQMQLRDLADMAMRKCESLPNPRRRDHLSYFADVYLHIRHHCEKGPLSLYDQGEGLGDFAAVCRRSGVHLSRGRLRGLLGKAIKRFDIYLMPAGLLEILVCTQ